MTSPGSERKHRFGGSWTGAKLEVLAGYLKSYTIALKKTDFHKEYIDAFAGTGYRDVRQEGASTDDPQALLFPDLAESEPQGLLEGSASLALRVDPPFDQYVFIDRSPVRCAALEALKDEHPTLADFIEIRRGNANEEIVAMCGRSWRSRRAVLFLDPYGMQVDWETIEAVACTRAVDLWLLFPLGIGVNRLLTKSGNIPPAWRRRLDKLLGTGDWYDEFYKQAHTQTLFGEERTVIKARTETIGRYFVRRLQGIFAGVVKEPGVLRNSRNCPLYLLCFACGNPKGARVALKIANHLLKELR